MNASTKLCCLIGNPVEHSISPLIHNTIAERMNINLAYTAFKVEEENISAAIKGAYALGILGLNVTVPHKCAVIPELKSIDEIAKHIGAVNTLVRCENGYKGYNTDIIGLERELINAGVIITGNDIIIIGAGGASRAIVYLCAMRKATRVWLLNRNVDKARELAKEVNSCFGNIVEAIGLDEFAKIPEGKYPVIQTTSVGMYPNTNTAAIMDDDFYNLVSCGIDIIFNPYETLFMKKCMEHGAEVKNGLEMLLYQGVAAFELWNDVIVPDYIINEVLELMIREMISR